MTRPLTDSEREAMETPLREYWIQKDGLLPKETRAFEAGFIIGLDHSAAQLAALQTQLRAESAERDGLRAALQLTQDERGQLRDALADMLYIFDRGLPEGSIGRMRCDQARDVLARRALEPPTT